MCCLCRECTLDPASCTLANDYTEAEQEEKEERKEKVERKTGSILRLGGRELKT